MDMICLNILYFIGKFTFTDNINCFALTLDDDRDDDNDLSNPSRILSSTVAFQFIRTIKC